MFGKSFNPLEMVSKIPENSSYSILSYYRSQGESMIGVIRVKSDRPENAWESHRDGDELLFVLDGSLIMTLRPADAPDVSHQLGKGDVLFIPQGLPHSARILSPHVDVMFVTPVTGNHDWLETAS